MDLEIGALEIGRALDDIESGLEEVGARRERHPKLFSRLGKAKREQAALVEAMRAANKPGVRSTGGPGSQVWLGELPFPVGFDTLPKSAALGTAGTAVDLEQDNQADAFRATRLVVDQASATPALSLIQVQDVKFKNKSQYVVGAFMLASMYGPDVYYQPFRGQSIGAGADIEVVLANLDSAADKIVYASFWGDAAYN